MTFEDAMSTLLAGKAVARAGWDASRSLTHTRVTLEGEEGKWLNFYLVMLRLEEDGGQFIPTDEDRAACDWVERPVGLSG